MAMKKYLPQIILIFISIILCFHLFQQGLPHSDDLISMVIRSSAFHQSFKDGALPVRWLSRLNENYGYPVTNFLYPLPFYLAEPFHFLKFSSPDAVKAVMIFATLASGIFMYQWLVPFTSTLSAFIASLFYLLAPYHLTDLYQRGSLGEVVALAIAPIIFIFIDRFHLHHHLSDFLLGSFALSLLITAHNTLALLFLPIVIGYMLITSTGSKRLSVKSIHLIQHSSFLILSLCLSAYFWLPALNDLQFTRAGSIHISNIAEHFVPPSALIGELGLASLLVVLLSLVITSSITARWFQLVFSLAVLFQLPFMEPIWHAISLDRFIQFPFRLQAITVFAASFLTAMTLTKLKSSLTKGLFTFTTITLLLIPAVSILKSVVIDNFSPGFFETNFDTTTNQKEFTPNHVKHDPTTYARTPYEIQGPTGEYQVVESWTKTQETYLQAIVDNDIEVTFNTHYFPGWQVYVDDNLITPEILDDGRIKIHLTPGQTETRTIRLVWQETPIRKLADTVSLISLLGLLTYFIYLVSGKKIVKTLFYLSALVIVTELTTTILSNWSSYQQSFDPMLQEKKYLNSQWVNPISREPLGDHGLYAWAGWSYIHGTNPILINSEMPPLGKYLIGWGILFTQNPALVGTFFSLAFSLALYLLSSQIIQDRYLSLIPPALISTETIFKSAMPTTMLDPIQLTFVCLGFYFLLRSSKDNRWFVAAALMLGGVLSTKFYAAGILMIISIAVFYLASHRFQQLKWFLISLPLAALVHIGSYFQFFALGNSFRNYLGVQKYIYEFYKTGTTHVPTGSYWKLVFFNRWRVWWGPSWGLYYTLTTKEWQLTWPLAGLTGLFSLCHFINTTITTWKSKSKPVADYHLLTSWLLFYSIFLTFIGGWPHYMLLFLPFAYILAVKLIIDHHRPLHYALAQTGRFIAKKFHLFNLFD